MSTKINQLDFLKSIIENVPNGFVSTDRHGKISLINQQALRFFNKEGTPSGFIGLDLHDFFPSLYLTLREKIQKCIDDTKSVFNYGHSDILGKQLNIQGRNFSEGMILSIFDATEVLQAKNQDTLTLLLGEELNRKKLCKELHDGIGTLISSIKIQLDVVKTELGEIPQKTSEKINSVSQMMQTAANDLRSISQTFLPSLIIDFGLVPALESLIKMSTNETSININFYESGLNKRLDLGMELGIFRIIQETLTNSLTHGNSKNISIQLVQHENYISVITEDDGVGFDKNNLEEILQKGMGIRNIKTRTKSFNGIFHIDAIHGKGVTVNIELPTNK